MFERFTDRARRAVVLAQEEARRLDHDHIGTEHMLLGLLREDEGVAAQALRALDIDLDTVRREVEEIIGRGEHPPSGHIPFTPRAKKTLELAMRESQQLGHNYIGTEHMLLGILREGDGVAAQVLVRRAADLDKVRQEVIRLLHGPGSAERSAATHLVVEGTTLDDVLRELRSIDRRLAAIEAKLGIEEPPARRRLREIDTELARVRRQKEAAVADQDFERAVRLRDEEMKLVRLRREVEAALAGDNAPADATGTPGGQAGEEPPGTGSGQ